MTMALILWNFLKAQVLTSLWAQDTPLLSLPWSTVYPTELHQINVCISEVLSFYW